MNTYQAHQVCVEEYRGMMKTTGYGSKGARESGMGYGDVFWVS